MSGEVGDGFDGSTALYEKLYRAILILQENQKL
jgi:hypothetical protein